MKDQDGLVVNNVSSEADPWIVTASISNGVGALVNNLTCSFSGSLCVFENLAIDTMGEGYQLQFELTYPVLSIPAVVCDPFDVFQVNHPQSFSLLPIADRGYSLIVTFIETKVSD